jgi:hypothetical protein
LSINWVDQTRCPTGLNTGPSPALEPVSAYTLINASASCALGRGFTLGATAFNVADHRHYEILPEQSGEVIGRRLVGTLSYSF